MVKFVPPGANEPERTPSRMVHNGGRRRKPNSLAAPPLGGTGKPTGLWSHKDDRGSMRVTACDRSNHISGGTRSANGVNGESTGGGVLERFCIARGDLEYGDGKGIVNAFGVSDNGGTLVVADNDDDTQGARFARCLERIVHIGGKEVRVRPAVPESDRAGNSWYFVWGNLD